MGLVAQFNLMAVRKEVCTAEILTSATFFSSSIIPQKMYWNATWFISGQNNVLKSWPKPLGWLAFYKECRQI